MPGAPMRLIETRCAHTQVHQSKTVSETQLHLYLSRTEERPLEAVSLSGVLLLGRRHLNRRGHVDIKDTKLQAELVCLSLSSKKHAEKV